MRESRGREWKENLKKRKVRELKRKRRKGEGDGGIKI